MLIKSCRGKKISKQQWTCDAQQQNCRWWVRTGPVQASLCKVLVLNHFKTIWGKIPGSDCYHCLREISCLGAPGCLHFLSHLPGAAPTPLQRVLGKRQRTKLKTEVQRGNRTVENQWISLYFGFGGWDRDHCQVFMCQGFFSWPFPGLGEILSGWEQFPAQVSQLTLQACARNKRATASAAPLSPEPSIMSGAREGGCGVSQLPN